MTVPAAWSTVGAAVTVTARAVRSATTRDVGDEELVTERKALGQPRLGGREGQGLPARGEHGEARAAGRDRRHRAPRAARAGIGQGDERQRARAARAQAHPYAIAHRDSGDQTRIAGCHGVAVAVGRTVAQGRGEYVVLVKGAGIGVGCPVVEPARAALARAPSGAVGGAEEAPVDVHEDVDAGLVVERHLAGAGARPRRDEMLGQQLVDHPQFAGHAGTRGPQAPGHEHRGHRARAVKADAGARCSPDRARRRWPPRRWRDRRPTHTDSPRA